jgi:leader peptidase (prepilin peptidase)/N-methyltransferase
LNPGLPTSLAALPPVLLLGLVAAVGLCVGSFLNVVISRLPAGQSVVTPGSHCGCGAPIPWYLNIPVVSWLALRGHARCCGRAISWRYPAVELGTAVLFVLTWRQFPNDPVGAICGWAFVGSLLAATVIDWEHLIIPEPLTLGLGIVGLLLSALHPALHGQFDSPFAFASLRSVGAAATGLAIGSGLLLWIACLATTLLKREAMGMGDVIFVGAIGTFCGWHGAVFAIFGGAAVGAVLAPVFLLRAKSAPWEARLPFGPMLAIAGAAYFLGLSGPVDAWFARSAALFQ